LESSHEENEDWPRIRGIQYNTKTLILGDSVTAGLHQRKMAVDCECSQVLSISGLNRSSLLQNLKGTTPQPAVTTLVVHCGINDCKRGYVIGSRAWRVVISEVRRCFPKARIMLSSILPHRDNHAHINTCINDSNFYMKQACEQANVEFVDNDLAFFTKTGEMKTGWMRDEIHPNVRGSSGLAVSIKWAYSHGFFGTEPAQRPGPPSKSYANPTATNNTDQRPRPNRHVVQPSRFAGQRPVRMQHMDRHNFAYNLQPTYSQVVQKGQLLPPNTVGNQIPTAHQHLRQQQQQQPEVPLDLTRQRQPMALTEQERKVMFDLLSRLV